MKHTPDGTWTFYRTAIEASEAAGELEAHGIQATTAQSGLGYVVLATVSAYTPGPWSIVAYLDEHDRRGANVLVSEGTLGAKHRVHSRNHCIAYTVPRLEDARLIAAAPDLLAALLRTIELLEPYGDEEADEPHSIGDALISARAVIAKAIEHQQAVGRHR